MCLKLKQAEHPVTITGKHSACKNKPIQSRPLGGLSCTFYYTPLAFLMHPASHLTEIPPGYGVSVWEPHPGTAHPTKLLQLGVLERSVAALTGFGVCCWSWQAVRDGWREIHCGAVNLESHFREEVCE